MHRNADVMRLHREGTIEREVRERQEEGKHKQNEHLFFNMFIIKKKKSNTYTLLESLQGCQATHYVPIVEA